MTKPIARDQHPHPARPFATAAGVSQRLDVPTAKMVNRRNNAAL
jgi:hypothetical protein